jgi:serine O-acetyltransferase
VTEHPLYATLRQDADLLLRDSARFSGACAQMELEAALRRAVTAALADLEAVVARDAAAAGDLQYVYDSYLGYQAVLAYRVAHQLVRLARQRAAADRREELALRTAARQLSERAKVNTGVEIHPSASIGQRFVVDHGFGTVIGEQAEIGDDCYLLQGVTLGGRSIGRSSLHRSGRRHPRIGHRVEIGSGATVFGPVTVGDDCRLEPGVCITMDIPPGARVRLMTTIQVCENRYDARLASS